MDEGQTHWRMTRPMAWFFALSLWQDRPRRRTQALLDVGGECQQRLRPCQASEGHWCRQGGACDFFAASECGPIPGETGTQ